ncbi:MAG: hypothetical protein MI974_10195 [Chitinophagales bacterium]|nr:hypothetical protein [Chitinophagales bacterium]
MDWFEQLTGFEEESPDQVRSNLILRDRILTSKANGRSFEVGKFELVSLESLRDDSLLSSDGEVKIKISEVIGDVQEYHLMPENHQAVFQAASQFNLLEMVHPEVTPEMGIGRYEYDLTQGPACAIACGAGTIFRNYFVELDGQQGQTANCQIDCLSAIGHYFNNEEEQLWQMKNGYALVNQSGLEKITAHINSLSAEEYEYLKGLLMIGIQNETEVTLTQTGQKVSQIYCSALPVAYSMVPPQYWRTFGMLILEATYEATLWAALRNKRKTANNRLFLTLVGGGAFGNEQEWLYTAILKNIKQFMSCDLDIRFISYGASNSLVRQLLNDWRG